MPIITLTTDWGSGDPYVAAFKGDLLRRDPSVRIEHISHDIPKHDLLSAAFFAVSTFHHFPKGTVHFLGLESGGGHKPFLPADYLIARFQEHFFVGADSGIFHMIFQDQPFECWKLDMQADITMRELYSKLSDTLVALSNGKDPNELGIPKERPEESNFTRPMSDSSGIRCSVIYVDSNGNAVFNVTKSLFERERKGRNFSILARKAAYRVDRISTHYNDVEEGDMLALFNQNDFLVIAMNKDNASRLIGFKVYDTLLIEFHDNQDR